MSTETVKHGRYWGFTRAELEEERAKYKDAVKQSSAQSAASGGGRIGSGNVGGQSVSFVYPPGIGSLEEWRFELEDAFAQLDGEGPRMTDRSIAQFR